MFKSPTSLTSVQLRLNRAIAKSKLRELLEDNPTKNAEIFYKRLLDINEDTADKRIFLLLSPYQNSSDKVKVKCGTCGDFNEVRPSHITSLRTGCPTCKKTNSRKTTKQFIKDAINIYGSLCSYSLVSYINAYTPIKIICKKHGVFERVPHDYLKGVGCPKCGQERKAQKQRLGLEEIKDLLDVIHGEDKYNLIQALVYKNIFSVHKVKHLKCKHIFSETIDNLIYKKVKCPKCYPRGQKNISKEEKQVRNFVKFLHKDLQINNRLLLKPKELDLYLPSLSIALEYNGNYWHSDRYKPNNYHFKKSLEAEDKGVKLFHIWEDQWKNRTKRLIWKSMIKAKLGKIKTKIHGRKCQVRKLEKTPIEFYQENHIQGKVNCSVNYGLFYQEELVVAMGFRGSELVRFCSKRFTVVHGAFSKLLKAYIKEYNPKEIVSFSDNDYSDGGIYRSNNFKLVKELKQDYFYVKAVVGGYKRYHKFTMRKQKLKKRYGLTEKEINSLTEKQITETKGYLRCYNSGKKKWLLRNSVALQIVYNLNKKEI